MKNKALQFCSETIHPGEAVSLALPLPEMFSCAPLYMPVKVVHGRLAGPCLLVTAAMHGNELNGTEIINRLLEFAAVKKCRGTLIAVPVLNVQGLVNRSRYLPSGISLNSCFPGSANGTMGSRIAHIITQELVAKADVCIDLQTGFINYSNLPQAYVTPGDAASRELALAFNAPVVTNAPLEKQSMRELMWAQNKRFFVYEAGEAMRFDEHAIKVGVKGLLNVMRKLDMLPERTNKNKEGEQLKAFFAQKNIWVRASTSGVSHSKLTLGQYVEQGEVLAVIKDPFGASETETITCPEAGVVVGKNNLPLVHEGEGLFQLAVFSKMDQAASHLEDWQEKSEERFADSGQS